MVILLSAVAVVVAAVLFVIWVVTQGGFALIFASMGLASLSMVLLWAARWIGSSPEGAGPDAPEPLGAAQAITEPPTAPRVPGHGDETPEPVLRPTRTVSPATFPIAEYDDLWVSQIVPLVGELDHDELAMLEARERGGRRRAAVLSAIDVARPSASTVGDEPAAGDIAELDTAGSDHLVDLTDPVAVQDRVAVPVGAARVRTFLGRRRSPITIR